MVTRTRDEWCAIFAGTDACVTPVLTLEEAPTDSHLAARDTFVNHNGQLQPAPAPRFSRTPSQIQQPPATMPGSVEHLLDLWRGEGSRAPTA